MIRRLAFLVGYFFQCGIEARRAELSHTGTLAGLTQSALQTMEVSTWVN